MTSLFAYKMVRDFGFAPNPFGGLCTLATCKPNIRRRAAPGDLVVACGSVKNGRSGRVICAMRVGGAMTFQEYWEDPRFERKKAALGLSRQRAFGDNIYHHAPDGSWIQEDSHHSQVGGVLNPANLHQDTSADRILWASEFTYWGREAPVLPAEFDGFGLARVRDFRGDFEPEFVNRTNVWFDGLPRGRLGRPIDWT